MVQLFDSVQVTNLISLEGHISVEHGVETDSCTPDVDGEALITHVLNNFRSYVGRGAALLEKEFVFLNSATYSEITDLDISMAVKQNIVKLYITVRDTVLVEIGDALHDLLEHKLSILFSELSSLAHVVEKVATRA